jgi:hypothetical protein
MAFYIRKAFKTGPVRLNLSKGGLGLSAGITGARVGINSRGTYVHGGRHGLYYRKYLKQGKPSSTGGGETTRYGRSTHHSGTVSLFRDTGVTFPTQTAVLHNVSREEPSLPSSTLITTPVQLVLGAAILISLITFTQGLEWLLIPTLLFAVAALGWMGRNLHWKQKAQKLLTEIVTRTEKQNKLKPQVLLPNEKMPDRWRTWLNVHVNAVISELAMRHEELDTLSTLRTLDEQFPANQAVVDRIRASVLGDILDEMLEDHLLSEDEEESIRQLLEQSNLPEPLITLELERLDHYSRIRQEIERPLKEIDPGIPLVRGESAYEQFNRVRLLNERVLNRFQRDNVQYRELGYEIDSEGTLILTDRRLLIIDRGSREYRLNRLVDVTADPEAGIVELVLSNRKSPVIITVEEPLVLAARIEKVLEEIVSQ